MLKYNEAGLLISADEMLTKHGQVALAMADEIKRLRQEIAHLRAELKRVETENARHV